VDFAVFFIKNEKKMPEPSYYSATQVIQGLRQEDLCESAERGSGKFPILTGAFPEIEALGKPLPLEVFNSF
jgi:hypothetical protein